MLGAVLVAEEEEAEEPEAPPHESRATLRVSSDDSKLV